MKKLILATLTLAALSGCIWNVDRPNPYEYERWSTPANATSVEISMLECGYPDIFGFAGYGLSDEDIIYAEKCMRFYGYKQRNSYGDYLCRNRLGIKGCSDSYVPRRDPLKRLNSAYCKIYKKSSYCK